MILKSLSPASFLAALFLLSSPLAAQYGELPIRPNLAPEPYFRTEDGRQNKREPDALINRFRLYDFYRRQADWHLSNPSDTRDLLPPYPGLDGGRRGHWGATNEKETTALRRDQSPDFSLVTSRRNDGEFYVLDHPGTSGSLIVMDSLAPGFRRAYANASLSVPEHPFGLGADRFGFELKVAGDVFLEGAKTEWTRDSKPVAWFGGYQVHGKQAVFSWELEKTRVLDLPSLHTSPDGKQTALVRRFEFLDAAPNGFQLALPLRSGGKGGSLAPVTKNEPGPGLIIQLGDASGVTLHRFIASVGVRVDVSDNGSKLELFDVGANARLQVLSWTGPPSSVSAAEAWLEQVFEETKNAIPSSLLRGGPSRFTAPVATTAKLNADPEASGTTYEIDDVALPFDHPDHTPLTLSGLSFASDGTAYACSLVGDVWKITGLHGDMREVRWKRYAAGLNLPMGLEVVDGVPYVATVPHLLRLTDLNGDGEADHYERISRMPLPGTNQNGRDLRRDASGNFCYNTAGGIYRLSPDGGRLDKIGRGARNPFGLGVRADGLVISDSSEGNSENGTCTLYESDHPENAASAAKGKRLLYFPRGVENSPGSRLFLDEPRFGPLGKSLIGVSFGNGGWYSILRDIAGGTPQAAVLPMPGSFLSGACRLAVQPLDGQVFVVGLDGWGDQAVREGCLHRIRFTGRATPFVTAWQGHRNGLRLKFDQDLDPESVTAAAFFVQQWNYVDSPKTYGSPEYSVKKPGAPGHDRLKVAQAVLLPDRRTVFLHLPELLPAMCSQVRATLADASGKPVSLDCYATLQRLHPDAPEAAAAPASRIATLTVPRAEENGSTYQNLLEHFDRLAGRESAKRAVTPEITYRSEDLNYGWIKTNVLTPHCFPCHGPGTQHDYSTVAGLRLKVRTDAPAKSVLHGMVSTGGMPPYPLPALSPSMKKALLDWIQKGAPE